MTQHTANKPPQDPQDAAATKAIRDIKQMSAEELVEYCTTYWQKRVNDPAVFPKQA